MRRSLCDVRLVLAEDGEGFVEAAGLPEGFDRAVEDDAEAAGSFVGSLGDLGRGEFGEVTVVGPASAGDAFGHRPAAGDSAGFVGQGGFPGDGFKDGARRGGSSGNRDVGDHKNHCPFASDQAGMKGLSRTMGNNPAGWERRLDHEPGTGLVDRSKQA